MQQPLRILVAILLGLPCACRSTTGGGNSDSGSDGSAVSSDGRAGGTPDASAPDGRDTATPDASGPDGRDAAAPDASGPDGRDAAGPDASGPDGRDAARGADVSSDRPGGTGGTWAAVQAILASDCVRCHDPAHPVVPETPTYVAMDLTAAGAYAALVRKPAHETCGGTLVVPGDPSRSYLFHKVNDDHPCDGLRMPHRGMVILFDNKLPQAKIDTIAAWILAGAPP